MTEPESRYFESSRLRLHYVVWGDESKPALLLVHGGHDHARSWDFVAQRFLDRYAVYCLDLRGHGDSDWSQGPAYQTSHHVSDLARLIDVLGRERVDIVAHSMGGRITIDYACAFPEKVGRIVSVEGVGRPPNTGRPPEQLRRYVDEVRKSEQYSPHVYPTIEAAEKRMYEANTHLSPEMVEHLTLHAVRKVEGGFTWKYDPYTRVRSVPDWSHEEFREMWGQLKAPTLMISGRESWFIKEQLELVREALPGIRIEIVENAGHWVHHDQMDRFVQLVSDFLA